MKLKSILLTGLSFVLVTAVAIGGTLAYLTSTDDDVNVMTLGNVKIEQIELQRVQNDDGTYPIKTIGGRDSYMLEAFEQGKMLVPTTEIDDKGKPVNYGAGNYQNTVVMFEELGSYNGMQVFKSENAVDKFVFVKNTGNTPAYVRTLIAFEMGSLSLDESKLMTRKSYHGAWNIKEAIEVTIDGKNYAVYEYVYQGFKGTHTDGVLPAGATTPCSLAQVYLNSAATNETVEKLDGNKNGTYDILVVSQAVQADGFADAETALDTAFGDITTTNHPWAGGVKIPAVVEDADGLVEALESGKDVVFNDDVKIDPAGMSNAYGTTGINVKNGQTIDGNGNTLDIKGAGGTWDSGINTTGGLIKNLTVTGSFRGIFINHNSSHSEPVVLENVIIDGTTYTISCDQGMYQTLTATNSTFNGWTSFAATLGEATFIDCSFGEGNGYAYCRPYAPTTFVGCEFEAGYTLDPRADVTFENCTLNGVALTDANIADLVTSTAKVTVK